MDKQEFEYYLNFSKYGTVPGDVNDAMREYVQKMHNANERLEGMSNLKELYKSAYRDVRLVNHLVELFILKKRPVPPYLMLERNPCSWKAFESYMARVRSEKMTKRFKDIGGGE